MRLLPPAHSRATTGHPAFRAEDGLSLVEVLVAILLSATVIAMLATQLTGMFENQARVAISRQAQDRAAGVHDQFASDLRAALSPDRLRISSEDGLADAVGVRPRTGQGNGRGNGRPGADDPTLPADLDVRDILVADATNLWFRSDVVPEAAGEPITECVGYFLDSSGALVREVRSDWRTCTGTVTRHELLPAPPDGVATVSLFSYSELVDRGGNGNGNGGSGSAGTGNGVGYDTAPGQVKKRRWVGTCESRGPYAVTYDATTPRINQIVAVRINLNAVITGAGSTGSQGLNTLVEVRNRLTDDYLYALGCTA